MARKQFKSNLYKLSEELEDCGLPDEGKTIRKIYWYSGDERELVFLMGLWMKGFKTGNPLITQQIKPLVQEFRDLCKEKNLIKEWELKISFKPDVSTGYTYWFGFAFVLLVSGIAQEYSISNQLGTEEIVFFSWEKGLWKIVLGILVGLGGYWLRIESKGKFDLAERLFRRVR